MVYIGPPLFFGARGWLSPLQYGKVVWKVGNYRSGGGIIGLFLASGF